jgi:16S rRNA (guanine966-N2)-methyltransferase
MHILAGEFKGRTLLSPPTASASRPITAAAKKSLFDILAPRLVDVAVVDLYCGTGTLGLEALSRGARRCFFADRDRRVLDRLRRNIQSLGVQDHCTVWSGNIPVRLAGWLEAMAGPVDVAFVDPPYADARRWSWPTAEVSIFAPLATRLAEEGWVVLRVPIDLHVPQQVGVLTIRRTKTYGDMKVVLLGAGGPAGEA